ncbi:MAG: dihydrolipoyl dehydrogenase [Planctomycetes bacterium]|nr:dihydrolipoyl dehydrogenase [Planctomycetota bacterium]MCH9724535.1 dihydrolipoyl dehydrogenase [Planctomycetota bacterium]MCH9776177.1 dihydrolipoyl dehydrogenase [Planctomycetota bacterium]MCH9791376.1 dihydrolipoyl dehydrogenase [Planctomycetota bacterium]MDF1746990.1 dihydrolipoyl dehydrogenase [Gimesia sp.]
MNHDLVIIGAGPGGYIAAIRAAQLGLNVACIEKERMLGGTCLRVGCIPSKALLESSELYKEAEHSFKDRGINVGALSLDLAKMLSQKDRTVKTMGGGIDSLFKKNKITRYSGHATITAPGKVKVDDGKETTELEAKHILIATGSQPSTLPGIELDGDKVGSSTEALKYEQVPKHLVVIGGGVIGLELGAVWNRLGAKVTILEYLDRILPTTDTEIANEAKKIFEKQGLEFQLGCRVTGVKTNRKTCDVEIADGKPIRCDRVLMAVGRRPNTDQLGLDDVGIVVDQRGFIPVNAHYETTVKGIYAIGDVIGGAMLAHKAEEEGVAFAERLVTGYGHVNYDTIPSVAYTNPEIAAVGRTEEQLKEEGIEYRKGSFPFLANGRARAMGQTEGRVKMLADKKTDRVLGVHIIGPRAGDLIAECAVAMEFGASSEDIARCCHAHPTLAEAVKEAALAVDRRALNF